MVTFSVTVMVPPDVSFTITLEPVNVEFLKDIDGPLDITGETITVTVTLPANPLILFRLIAEVFREPAVILREVGLAAMPKSTTFTGTCTDFRIVRLVPVMVIV